MAARSNGVGETATRSRSQLSPAVLAEGWLVKSREHGLRFPLLKSKWVRRYFVLRQSELGPGNYALDEFRSDSKRRLRKSLDMERCIQVDSYLQLSDSSCAARGGGYQWIFSMYFSKKNSEKRVEVYLVAESEEEMLKWVSAICRACRLEKQDGPIESDAHGVEGQIDADVAVPMTVAGSGRGLRSDGSLLSTSLAGMSLSSNVSSHSFDSTFEGQADDSRNKQKRDYMHINKFYSRTTPRTPRSKGGNSGSANGKGRDDPPPWHGESSASACSSVSSSRRSLSDEDESSSCVSSSASGGREIGPLPVLATTARKRLTEQLSSASSSVGSTQNSRYNVHLSLNQPVPPPPPTTLNESAENESSGETIKILGVRHNVCVPSTAGSTYVNASVARGAHRIPVNTIGPPAIDRSKKPSRLRPDSDDDRPVDVTSLDGSRRFSSRPSPLPALPKTTPRRGKYQTTEAPKSAGPLSSPRSALDYFDPVPIGSSEPRPHGRSPPPVDIDYIRIDAQRTQAVKQLLAQRGATFD